HKLRRRERLGRAEAGLSLYGILGVAFTVFSLITSFFYWRSVFGGLVSRLWHGGSMTRVLLILLALFVTGPLIRGALNLVRSLFKRLRAVVERVRFALQTKWRGGGALALGPRSLFGGVLRGGLDGPAR